MIYNQGIFKPMAHSYKFFASIQPFLNSLVYKRNPSLRKAMLLALIQAWNVLPLLPGTYLDQQACGLSGFQNEAEAL